MEEGEPSTKHANSVAPFWLRLRLSLLGAALAAADVRDFLDSAHGNLSERVIAVQKGLRPAPNGILLGYEVLGDGIAESHSLLCTGSDEGAHRDLGTSFNRHGLIDDWNMAKKVARWASEDDHAEPCDYYAFRLTEYEWRH